MFVWLPCAGTLLGCLPCNWQILFWSTNEGRRQIPPAFSVSKGSRLGLSMPLMMTQYFQGFWSTNFAVKNYTSVDPKQFTVSKFRLKPVILISECFCSRCGHTNQHPPPTWRETTGDNGRQDHFRAQEGGHTNQHPPPTLGETTGDNGRQDHLRAQEADHTNQHQGGQI